MRRMVLIAGLALVAGIAVGVVGSQILNAQPAPVQRTVLQKVDLAGIEGKEGILYVAQLAPGAAAGKHSHPGEEFGYVLQGSLNLEPEGKPPVTLKAGESFHNPLKNVHDAKNGSQTEPTKVLVFLLAEKGQPLSTPAK